MQKQKAPSRCYTKHLREFFLANSITGFPLRLCTPQIILLQREIKSVLNLQIHLNIITQFKRSKRTDYEPPYYLWPEHSTFQATQLVFIFSSFPPYKKHLRIFSNCLITEFISKEKEYKGRQPSTKLTKVNRPLKEKVLAFQEDNLF